MASYADKVIADGATAYWRLGETSGLTAVDLVGGKNGTISGGVTLGQTGALADADKAMAFNGIASQVAATATVLDALANITLEVWVYVTTTTATGGIVAKTIGGTVNSSFSLLYQLDEWWWRSGDNVTAPVLSSMRNNWTHLVGTWDGTTSRLYVNGVLASSLAIPPVSQGAGPLFIGGLSNGQYGFVGLADEVAIYPTALTAQQIRDHYALSKYAAGSYPYQVIHDGATAFWRLGETSGTTAVDVIGGANGTISGGVTLGQAGALADGDKAMLFNGTTGKIDTPLSLTLPATYTVEAWIKPTTLPGQAPVFVNLTSFASMYFGTSGTKLFAYANSGTPAPASSTADVMTGVWQQAVWVITAAETRFYINGVLGGTVAQTKPAQLAGTVNVGFSQQTGEFWSGALDEVAYYPTALTPAQIATHYALSKYKAGSYPALVIADGASAYWRLGELSGTTANDEVGTADGTISGGVTLGQAGALADGNKAMAFDGTTGKIVTAANVPLLVPYTVEAWVRTSVTTGQKVILSTLSEPTPQDALMIQVNAQWLRIYIEHSGGASSDLNDTQTLPFALADGAWHHVVIIFLGATVAVYVDGVQRTWSQQPAVTLVGSSTHFLDLGTDSKYALFYSGNLDDVAIYPTALTAPQIAAHYAAREFTSGGVGFPGIPWWIPLDEGEVAVPFNVWEQITPHDTNDINPNGEPTDAILVGGGGDVAAVMTNKQVVVLKGLPAGAFVPIAARRVNATGTSATNLTALYVV